MRRAIKKSMLIQKKKTLKMKTFQIPLRKSSKKTKKTDLIKIMAQKDDQRKKRRKIERKGESSREIRERPRRPRRRRMGLRKLSKELMAHLSQKEKNHKSENE